MSTLLQMLSTQTESLNNSFPRKLIDFTSSIFYRIHRSSFVVSGSGKETKINPMAIRRQLDFANSYTVHFE